MTCIYVLFVHITSDLYENFHLNTTNMNSTAEKSDFFNKKLHGGTYMYEH
jgi:hypothetical protein